MPLASILTASGMLVTGRADFASGRLAFLALAAAAPVLTGRLAYAFSKNGSLPKVPSVTFKGPGGHTRTIKVQHPEKLEGVNVGDMVDLTYTEAIAVKVEKAPKK